MHIHLSNHAAARIPDSRDLHTTWRDLDQAGVKAARELFAWLDAKAPNTFILISTGDRLIPPCATAQNDPHQYHEDCQTNDDLIRHLIITRENWQANQEYYLSLDTAWREEHSQCTLRQRALRIHQQLLAQTP